MAENPDKQALIAQLAQSRREATFALSNLTDALNVPARFQNSVRENKTSWLAGAGLTGWLLSRLPARKKKVKVFVKADGHGHDSKIKEVAQAGLLLTIGKLLFSLLRPMLTRLLTEKLGDAARDYVAQRMERRESPVQARTVRR